jgi:hypothetical protein
MWRSLGTAERSLRTDTRDGQRVRSSGEAWAAADAAGGTDPDDARAAAERCIAAYTAPPEAPVEDG